MNNRINPVIPGIAWDAWMIITLIVIALRRQFTSPRAPKQLAISKRKPIM